MSNELPCKICLVYTICKNRIYEHGFYYFVRTCPILCEYIMEDVPKRVNEANNFFKIFSTYLDQQRRRHKGD